MAFILCLIGVRCCVICGQCKLLCHVTAAVSQWNFTASFFLLQRDETWLSQFRPLKLDSTLIRSKCVAMKWLSVCDCGVHGIWQANTPHWEEYLVLISFYHKVLSLFFVFLSSFTHSLCENMLCVWKVWSYETIRWSVRQQNSFHRYDTVGTSSLHLKLSDLGKFKVQWWWSKSVEWWKSWDRSWDRKQFYHDQMTSCLTRHHCPFCSLKCVLLMIQ